MARTFTTPIALPGDPTTALQAATKQYTDAVVIGYARIQIPTATKTAAYTAVMNDIVMVDATSGPVTITLPVIAAAGRISVKKVDTSANVVTVAAGGTNTIGTTAAASVPVRYQDQTTTFQASSSAATNWVLPYNHLPPTVLSTYAPLASPTFTGTVTVPTPVNATDPATKTYVDTADAAKAPLASPTFTGTVTVPTPGASTSAATKGYVDGGFVPTTQRGPIGGVTAPAYAATVTPDATAAVSFRYVATGAMTVNTPTGGVDGQHILIEVQASGANRTITFAAGFEVSQAVPGRVFTVTSANWGYFAAVYRSGTWRLVSAEPQTAITVPTLPATSAWIPGDHGLLAWTFDPILINGTLQPGNAQMGAVKLDQAATVSNVLHNITGAGATFTANRNYIGLYNSAGTLVASTADQAANWTSTGIKTTTFTTAYAAAAGTYYLMLISTATTRPTWSVLAPLNAALAVKDLGRTSASYRSGFSSTAYTALPATLPAMSGGNFMVWFGLS